MRGKKLIQHARSPWFLAPFCIGLGAAATVAIIGTPRLWSAEGAGWASALATMAAVIVALAVGILPELNRRRESEVRAFGQIHMCESSLEVQLYHLGQAIVASRAPIFDLAVRRAVLVEMQQFNPAIVTSMFGFAEHLSKDAFKATARCAVDMERVGSLIGLFRTTPDDADVAGGGWLGEHLVMAYLSMDDARTAYSKLLSRKPNEIPEIPEEVVAARAKELRIHVDPPVDVRSD